MIPSARVRECYEDYSDCSMLMRAEVPPTSRPGLVALLTGYVMNAQSKKLVPLKVKTGSSGS